MSPKPGNGAQQVDGATASSSSNGHLFLELLEGTGAARQGQKRAQQLASEIESEIVRLGWPVGLVLGSEPELMERYKVSRAVFREAMRLLEHHHIAEMRRGRRGGLTVVEPDPAFLTDATALYLQYHHVSRQDLFEARIAIELSCARLAAERADEDSIEALRAIANVVPSTSGELAENSAAFHQAVAAASGNPALHLFVQVLYALTATAIDHSSAMPVASEVHHVHAAIAEAIAAGDAAIAQRRMMRHFEAMTKIQGLTT